MSHSICPSCGQAGARERRVAEYDYKECGLPGVRLVASVLETSCAQCGQHSVHIPKEGQLLQVIAVELLTRPRALSGAELRFLRKSCRLSQAALADHLRKRRETVAEREAKSDPRLSEAEDVWFRLVILREFNALQARPAGSLLSAAQRERLARFTHDFTLRALELDAHGHRRLALCLQRSGDDWQAVGKAA